MGANTKKHPQGNIVCFPGDVFVSVKFQKEPLPEAWVKSLFKSLLKRLLYQKFCAARFRRFSSLLMELTMYS